MRAVALWVLTCLAVTSCGNSSNTSIQLDSDTTPVTMVASNSTVTVQPQDQRARTADSTSPQVPADLRISELVEPLCNFRVDEAQVAAGTPFENVRAQLTANELGVVTAGQGDRLVGYYLDLEATRFVVVVDETALDWARSELPWLIEGSLRVSKIPIVIQLACHDLAELRTLRDAVLGDLVLQEAIAESRRSIGVGFSIDAKSGRLQVFLDDIIGTPEIVRYLEDTYGFAKVDVQTVRLLPGVPD